MSPGKRPLPAAEAGPPPVRWVPGLFSAVLLGAVLVPVLQNFRKDPRDSFPLSYYPMFSYRRGETERISSLVGLDEAGKRHVIPYRYAGVGGMNQVRRQIRRSVREGRAAELCRDVAGRVAQSDRSPMNGLVLVQVVTGQYRLDDYFRGNKAPVREKVEAACAVVRSAK